MNNDVIVPTGYAAKLAARSHYDAARRSRRLASWNPSSAGPNNSLVDLQTLRNRSRDILRNEWSAESATNNFVIDMVGTGIVARMTNDLSSTKRDKYDGLWQKFIKECDADGILDLYGMQALGAETWDNAGEFFFRIRSRRIEDGLTVPMQIQLLEPEMIPLLDRDLPSGNRIRQGIEFDLIGRRVNYWVYKQHPGDKSSAAVSIDDVYPVPADQIRHVYRPRRIGQLRGVPTGTSSMVKMKTVGDYDDAVVEKAKVQNLYVGVIKRPAPSYGADNVDPLTGKIIEDFGGDAPMVALEPGAVVELAPGEDMAFSNPPATGVGYNDFMRQQNLSIAGGRGVPYELMTGDIMNVSDRTLRVIIQQYRRGIEQKQWLTLIPMFCQPIRDAWVDAAVVAGLIPMKDADAVKDVEWSPQAWAYIHPVQDVQSKVLEIDNGIASRDSVIAGRGYDPEKVDRQRADAKSREEKLGLTQPAPDPTQAAADKQTAKQQSAQKAKAELDLLVAQTNAARLTAESEERRVNAYVRNQELIESRIKVESDLVNARLKESDAEIALKQAKAEEISANLVLAKARAEHEQIIVSQESEARIAEFKARAEAAMSEAIDRACALEEAELHAREQRAEVMQTERARAEVARLEVEAAKLGLRELLGEM